MKYWLVLYITLLCSSLLANDSLPEPETFYSNTPIFQGLLLVGNENDLTPEGYDSLKGVMAYHIKLPGDVKALKKMLKPLLKAPLSKELLLEIKKTVIEFYQNNYRPIVSVAIPEQNISHGVVQMIVKEATVGKLTVSGNTWSSKESIYKQVALEPGEVVSSKVLSRDLYWMNKNPFRRVDAVFSAGEKKDTTDIDLKVTERLPLRVFGGIDNIGNDVTGNNRFYTGVNWGNIFNTNQSLSFQLISASEFNRFHAYTLFYEAPLTWRHILSIYGGYSRVDAQFPIPNIKDTQFRTHGFSLQTSLRYTIPLQPMQAFLHDISWGFDFKRTNNNLDFGGRPVISQDNVNLTQLNLGYHLGYTIQALKVTFDVDGFWSPGQWIADQTNKDYASLRPFAKVQYVYTRGTLALVYSIFKEWNLRTYFRGQWASVNLLPSEEYGVGGLDTVRGYKERIVNGDNVFIWNLEMHTPSLSLLNPLSGWNKFNDAFSALVFFDYGLSAVNRTVPGQEKTTFLMSIGPGVRYTVNPYVNLRADWGFQLHNLHLGGPYQRLSFSLVIGY